MSLIGFKILSLGAEHEHYPAAVQFVRRVCFIPLQSAIALVDYFDQLIMYTHRTSEAELAALPFPTQPVYDQPDLTLLSNVDSKQELSGEGHSFTLAATGNQNISSADKGPLDEFLRRQWVRIGQSEDKGDFDFNDFDDEDFDVG